MFSITRFWKWLSAFERDLPPAAPRWVYPSITPELQKETLAGLCPELRGIVEGELSAGNRIIVAGSGGDWPWPDSTIIQLDLIFQSEPARLPHSLGFQPYDHKKGEGDSIFCLQHRLLLFAAMPTLQEHLSPTTQVGQKRRKSMNLSE